MSVAPKVTQRILYASFDRVESIESARVARRTGTDDAETRTLAREPPRARPGC